MTTENTKHCPRCDKDVAAEGFHKSQASKDGLASYCKQCVREYQYERYQFIKTNQYAHTKYKARARRYYIEGKERRQRNLQQV